MKNTKKTLIRRGIWYLIGFVLLYAPFGLIQVFLIKVLKLTGRTDIHGSCFRMVLASLAQGKGIDTLTTSGIITFVILIAAFFFGPQFCGKLCVAGALPEFASRFVPNKLKIDWQKYIPSAPVRYGALIGFIIAPALGISVACAYCNYSLMEKFVLGGISWNMAILSSAAILTGFVWLFVLGIFTKGGRGYCTYLCPIGAAQSILHRIGIILPFTYKLKLHKENCISCGLCEKECPTRAINIIDDLPSYNVHNCIACSQCVGTCPKKAITFGWGKGRWVNSKKDKLVNDTGRVEL